MTAPRGDDPVRAFLEEAVASREIPSAAWRVEAAGRVATEGVHGFATLEPVPEEAREDTPYDLASLTKPLVTGLLAALLEAEGRLDLEAPALGLLPELLGSAYEGASLLDLAAHRAGLPAWRPLYLKASGLMGYLTAIATESPPSAPGQTLYSDLGYILLGVALERAAGSTLDRLFDERVARPLGLVSIGFASGSGSGRFRRAAATERGNVYEKGLAGEEGRRFSWRTELIRGDVHDGNCWALGGVAGHAGLFGTAGEVAAIAREILAPSRLRLGPGARDRLLRPAVEPGSRTCGFAPPKAFPSVAGVLPEDAVGHMGFTGTSLWLDVRGRRLFVLLTNRVHPTISGEAIHGIRREFHRRAVELCDRAGMSPHP